MANEVSIKVSTDAKAATADFKRLTDQIHATEMAARRAGGGFSAMGNAAEHSLGRIAARAAQARREIEQMTRAQAVGPQFGAATGRAFTSGGGSLFLTGAGAGIAAGVTAGAGYIGQQGYSAYRDQAQAEAFLANAARQTGQAYAQQASEVAKLRRELGLTTAQATELQAASLRFTGTIGRPQDASRLGLALGNALAASGRSSSEIPDRLRQLQTGQDELFDVLGPVKIGGTFAGSPEAIYKAYAREILNVNRELSDLEKTQARYYAVLQAGAAAEGAAAERMATAAGRIDVLSAKVTDLAASFARAAVETKEFQGALSGVESLTGLAGGSGGQAVLSFIGRGLVASHPIIQALAGYDAAANAFSPTAVSTAKVGRDLLGQARSLGDLFGIGSPSTRRSNISPLDTLYNPDNAFRDPFGDPALASLQANRLARYQAALAVTRPRVGAALGAAGGNFSNFFALGSRLNELRAVSGGALETPAESATRFFGLAAQYGDIARASLGDEERAAQATRQFLVSGLAGADVRALSADQRAAYEDALLQSQTDQLKQAAEQFKSIKDMQASLKKLAERLAPDDAKEPEPTIIQIDNRSDTVARFAQASGDSLRGGAAGDF